MQARTYAVNALNQVRSFAFRCFRNSIAYFGWLVTRDIMFDPFSLYFHFYLKDIREQILQEIAVPYTKVLRKTTSLYCVHTFLELML